MAKKHSTTADSAVDLDDETVFVLHPQIDQASNLTRVDAITHRLYHIRAMCSIGIDAYGYDDPDGQMAPFLGRIADLAKEADLLVNTFHKAPEVDHG